MKKNATIILFLCAASLGLALSGCGKSGSAGSPASPTASHISNSMISGAATTDATVDGTVVLKDSSVPVQARKTTIGSDGSYTFVTTGLNAPYILKAEWTDSSGISKKMYSMATEQTGSSPMAADVVSTADSRANINPLSDVAVIVAAADTTPDDLFDNPDPARYRSTSYNLETVINSLRTVLAPLFALYQTSGDPITDTNEDNNSGFRAMFRDVRIVVNSGTVTVTNRLTSEVIFSGPLGNLSSGTFHPESMPAGPASNACTYTYSGWGACQADSTQTRTMSTASPAGCTGTPILAQACVIDPLTPSACTYTYNTWGACQSDSTQIRTVATALPAGCTGGTPVLSQFCTYVPPVTTITMANVTSSCTGCHGLTVNSTVFASGGYTVTGRTAAAWLTTVNNMVGQGASLAGGTAQDYANFLAAQPVTTTTCSSFMYSAWGTCQTDNTQSRTLASSSPAGCTGGTPVLSQSCIYVPPVTACTSFTYSAWGTCQSNSTQSRTVATSSPAGCTGGTPALSQSCTYVPPTAALTLAQVKTTCTQCHGLTVNTTVFQSGGYTVTGRTASSWLSAITGMGASPAPGTTLQDYANFLATLP